MDDGADPTLDHSGQNGAREPESRPEIDVQDRVPALVVALGNRTRAADPGIVDEHVDRSQLLGGDGDRLVRRGFIRQIDLVKYAAPRSLADLRGRAVHGKNRITVAQEAIGDRCADAGRRTGHDRHARPHASRPPSTGRQTPVM